MLIHIVFYDKDHGEYFTVFWPEMKKWIDAHWSITWSEEDQAKGVN